MRRNGAITFGDLVGKLDAIYVACDKCGRKGGYPVARLIEQRGRCLSSTKKGVFGYPTHLRAGLNRRN